jgi:uncharacterized protein (TIGR02996 family)
VSSLLAEIQASPDDDALRAVYADELLAAGDPRGELITVELALARALRGSPVSGDEAGPLFARRAELRAAHAERWWQLAPWQVHTRRGFATRVTLNRLDGALPGWLDDERVESVQLLALRSTNLAAVLASPALRHVRRLSLVNAPGAWLRALRESVLAGQLEALELWDCTAAVEALLAALPALRHLRRRDEATGVGQADASLEQVDVGAPSGEHWRFEQVDAEHWRVRVDGVLQPIAAYQRGSLQPLAPVAPIRETVTRLARGAGRASLGVGDAALTLSLYARDSRFDRCTIAAGVGGPLRIYDARANPPA